MDVRKKNIRNLSPDQAKLRNASRQKMTKKVQLVYYLSRGGQLEHPHFMEIVIPYEQELHLTDVMGRLAVLRGKEMPSMFSWSYKRRYKSGYVWNDLSEDDIILPVEGIEYVLKASEIFEDWSEKNRDCTSNISAPNPTQAPAIDLYFKGTTMSGKISESAKPKLVKIESKAEIPQLNVHHEFPPPKLHIAHKVCASRTKVITRNEDMSSNKSRPEPSQYILRAGNKSPNSIITTKRKETSLKPKFMEPTAHDDHRRRNKEEEEKLSKESEDSSQSSILTCSSRAQDDQQCQTRQCKQTVRAEEPTVSQSSGIFSFLPFLPCASVAVQNITSFKDAPLAEAKKRQLSSSKNKNQSRSKVADRTLGEELDCMLEDLQIINTQRAEKEYFSGSIVEIKSHGEAADPVLTRSASYDAERGSNVGMDVGTGKGNCGRGSCIPRFKL